MWVSTWLVSDCSRLPMSPGWGATADDIWCQPSGFSIGCDMLDGVTLDQLRTFLAAVDEGSFTAAGRRLGRAQSVVSHTLATMEERLGIRLFERFGRYPVLTRE